MKVEISDSLFEQYKEFIKTRFLTENISEQIEQLIERELNKYCVLGRELDVLTGTKTRHQLIQDLTRSLGGQGYNDNSILKTTFLCLDIDNFKKYLDFHGLTAGDQILIKIAEQLKRNYPKSNIYRIGGDEFVVEIGELNFTPFEIDKNINLKYSIVDISVQRDERSHHTNGLIMLNLHKGIIYASKNVTKIECKYPEIVDE